MLSRVEEPRSSLRIVAWLALSLALACGADGPGNPLLGEWEVDPQQTSQGALALVRHTGDDRIVFEADRVRLGADALPVRYEVGERRVGLVRTDLEYRHEVDLLEGERIRVNFPGGYAAVYRRARS